MKFALKRSVSLKSVAITFVIVSLLLIWLFTGIVFGYTDDEPKATLFLKKYPTFQIEFPNPDDSESDYSPFPELSSEKQVDIRAYCKFRYGVVSTNLSQIEACRQLTPVNAGSAFLGLIF